MPKWKNSAYAGKRLIRTGPPLSNLVLRVFLSQLRTDYCSGSPKDNSGVEYYDTIFTLAESPLQQGLIWAGSDDGLIHVARDGGQHWLNVTPKEMPEWIQINSIEASPHDAQTAYVAATMYKWDDFRPYLFVTHDTGKTWTAINRGIPDHSFTRVVREDPNHKGLLAAGTETGMFISFNGGADWQAFQLNLPVVPITDLAFHKREQELVVATQGRSFWILDDVPLLYQLSPAALKEPAHLFQPKDAVRGVRGGFEIPSSRPVGQNPAGGVAIYYSLAAKPKEKEEITIEILDADGKLVKKYSNIEKKEEGPADPEEGAFGPPRGSEKLPAEAGLNRFVWSLRYEDATKFLGLIMWAGNVTGPTSAPGKYTAKLTVAGQSQTQTFTVRPDPRVKTRPEDYAAQLALALQIRDKLSAVNQAVIEIREAKKQLARYEKEDKVKDAAKALDKKLAEVEEALYRSEAERGQPGRDRDPRGEEAARALREGRQGQGCGQGSRQEAGRGRRSALPDKAEGRRGCPQLPNQAEQQAGGPEGRRRRERRRADAAGADGVRRSRHRIQRGVGEAEEAAGGRPARVQQTGPRRQHSGGRSEVAQASAWLQPVSSPAGFHGSVAILQSGLAGETACPTKLTFAALGSANLAQASVCGAETAALATRHRFLVLGYIRLRWPLLRRAW